METNHKDFINGDYWQDRKCKSLYMLRRVFIASDEEI